MSKHIGYYYRCDVCGKEERKPYFDEAYVSAYPYASGNEWYHYNGEDVCKRCRDQIDSIEQAKKEARKRIELQQAFQQAKESI